MSCWNVTLSRPGWRNQVCCKSGWLTAVYSVKHLELVCVFSPEIFDSTQLNKIIIISLRSCIFRDISFQILLYYWAGHIACIHQPRTTTHGVLMNVIFVAGHGQAAPVLFLNCSLFLSNNSGRLLDLLILTQLFDSTPFCYNGLFDHMTQESGWVLLLYICQILNFRWKPCLTFWQTCFYSP